MASPQLLQLQDDADIEDEYIAIAKEQEIKNLAKDVSEELQALGDKLNATERKKKKIDRKEESVNNRSSSCLHHYNMDVVDRVIMLCQEQDATETLISEKKREKLLRAALQITDLASQFYLFEYLELACMLLDYPENPFADEFNRVKKCHEEVEEEKEETSQLVDEANTILGEMMESEEINKMKEKQFDNVVRQAHLKIVSCRSRLVEAEEITVKIDTILSTKSLMSRSVRAAGCLVSSYFFFQKYRESIISFPVFVAGQLVSGIAWLLSPFPENTYAFDKSLSNAALSHRELRRKLNDLFAAIESLKDNLTKEKQY